MIFLNKESLVPEVPRSLGLPPAPGEARGPQFQSFFDILLDFCWGPLFGPIGALGAPPITGKGCERQPRCRRHRHRRRHPRRCRRPCRHLG